MEVALVILDGWGLGPADDPDHRNAVAAAETPVFDALSADGAAGQLSASGRDVGLPAGQMGNSEVGHLNIGAGRIVYQEYTRINDSIAKAALAGISSSGNGDIPDPPLDEIPAITDIFDGVAATGGRLHILGLVSDGGVHSDYRHLCALIELAARWDVSAVTHAFTDGRDTSPTAGKDFISSLETFADSQGTGAVASVTGRYYAMDRDENWDRTYRAYEAIVAGNADHLAATGVAAVEAAYERGETDEFIEPTRILDTPSIETGDAILFANFRSDRARQLTRMIADIRPDAWRERGITTNPPDLTVMTLTAYDQTFDLPVAFEPNQPADTFGETLSRAGFTQLRIAESEKYAHVTYFLNGGREVEFSGETRVIVPSPDVPTYDQQPAMSAARVTDEAVRIIQDEDPDALVLNYANPDMVGHTGDFDATVSAIEAVDRELERLRATLESAGAHVIVTADHGNADDMGTTESPHTAHTKNPVPVVYLSPSGNDGGYRIRSGGILADIAPTLLERAGIPQPTAMTGSPLLLPADRE